VGLPSKNVVLMFDRGDPRPKTRDEVGENFHAVEIHLYMFSIASR
jgi:hypothetical protein